MRTVTTHLGEVSPTCETTRRVLRSSSLVSADFTLVPFWFPDFASYPFTVINHSCEATICWVLWVPLAKCQTWEWSWGSPTQIQNILISYGAIKHNLGVIFYTKQKPLTNQNHMSHLCATAPGVRAGWQDLSSGAYVAQTLLGMIIRKMRKGLLPMRAVQG